MSLLLPNAARFPGLLAALLAAGSLAAASCATPRAEVPKEVSGRPLSEDLDLVGRPVPDFTATDREGAAYSPAVARGKVLLIQLWGVNCGSCLEEMAYFDSSLYPDLAGKGLVIWGVNADQLAWGELAPEMKRVKAQAAYPLLADPSGRATSLFTTWFIPVTILVDTQGIVQYYKVGFSQADHEKIRAKIDSLLPRD